MATTKTVGKPALTRMKRVPADRPVRIGVPVPKVDRVRHKPAGIKDPRHV